MNNIIVAMVTFAFVGAVTPGPVNLLATSTALNHGKRAAVYHVIGASVAYALVVFCSGTIMQTLLNVLPKLETVMQLFGSLFLLYLSYKIYSSSGDSAAESSKAQSGWWTGALTQILNPKAWIVAMSGVSLYVIGQNNERQSLIIFVCVSLFVCLVGVGMWAVLGRILVTHLENPMRQRQFNSVMAGLLVVSTLMIWI